ncbi:MULTISPECIES: helix-turn-helix domain-containing protein [unclassified Xanthobacter]|uniref:helix-turn-helix domain-containing protein n=1 Tax=unclassified Xanthobacter TaxID=2623496 RepID=UPI001EDE92DF|nr:MULTISPECIES: helix-turn-helix domain-containing protein [unclassified Xanthobacter]
MTMPNENRPLKTAKQIAHELGVCERTVTRMVRKGILPATKGGCGGRTSPLILEREALKNLNRKKG